MDILLGPGGSELQKSPISARSGSAGGMPKSYRYRPSLFLASLGRLSYRASRLARRLMAQRSSLVTDSNGVFKPHQQREALARMEPAKAPVRWPEHHRTVRKSRLRQRDPSALHEMIMPGRRGRFLFSYVAFSSF